jgi:hypothetical protein
LGNIGPDAEVTILDYDSRDDLEIWVKTEYADELRFGRIRYAKLVGEASWHMTKAKNLAHLACTGDVVCNLDSDNWITVEHWEFLRSVFGGTGRRIALTSKSSYGGGFGRLALRRDDFIRLGGYDERFGHWGYDDCDLINRAMVMGLLPVTAPESSVCFLPHSDDERNFSEGSDRLIQQELHSAMSAAAIRAGNWKANADGWAEARLRFNFNSTARDMPAVISEVEKEFNLRVESGLQSVAKYEGKRKWGWFTEGFRRYVDLLYAEEPRRALEIGWSEGVSANMMLEVLFPHRSSEVHVLFPAESGFLTNEEAVNLENQFRVNAELGSHASQIHLYQGHSAEVLAWMIAEDGFWGSFDFIHISGSCHAADVYLRAALTWHLLKVGGVLCFDESPGDRQRTAGPPLQEAIETFAVVFANKIALCLKGGRRMYRKLKS